MQRLSQIIFLFSLVGVAIPSTALNAQVNQLPANKADKAYYDGRYQDAEVAYREKLEQGYEPRLQFNLGDALHGQGKYEEAIVEFGDASATAKNDRLRSGAYFNAGNTWMELDSIDASIIAYKNAIRSNPEDMEARYNLAVVQRMKEQQMQKQQQNQQQDPDQENEQKEPEQKEQQSDEDQQSSSQNQQQEGEQQSPPESSQGEDRQSSEQSKPEQQEGQKQSGQTGQPQRPGVTQQEARRLLRIMEKEEQKTIERQRQRSAPARKPEKDW